MDKACLLGHRLCILNMLRQFIPYQEDLVRFYGFENKYASCGEPSSLINVEAALTERERTLAALKEEMLRVTKNDIAEVIILGCAGLCGYEDELTQMVGTQVLDPVVVAVKVTEMMVESGLTHSKVRKFVLPPQALESYFLRSR